MNLYGVWGVDAQTLWTVGDAGTILRWNAAQAAFLPQASGETVPLFAIWGFAEDDVWAVGGNIDGDGVILHSLDGVNWFRHETVAKALLGIWGVDSEHLWAVGIDGAIYFFNGTSWSAQSSGISTHLEAVYGASIGNVWAVGEAGVILYFNGTVWSSQTSGVTSSLLAIWGTDDTHMWAVGQQCILKWDGVTWATQKTELLSLYIYSGIAGQSALSLRAFGYANGFPYGVKTTDGGTTWEYTSALPIIAYAARYLAPQDIAVGFNSSVARFIP